MDFSLYAAVLLDLDGTIYHEDRPLPGAVQLIQRLQGAGTRFGCLSNSTLSPQQLLKRFTAMGLEINPELFYTAAVATADFVLARWQRPNVFNLASAGIAELLNEKVNWVRAQDEPCDVVVAGDPACEFADYQRQRTALQLLRNGAVLVAMCADRIYPSPRGTEFGGGAFAAMLAYAAQIQPIFCGKPEPRFFLELCSRLQVGCNRCLLIGDNLDADITAAKKMGMATVLTLTGVTRQQDLVGLAEEKRPDHVVTDLTQL